MSLLPLFPLDAVLFPGTLFPLHIFEPRYREMIAQCIQEKKQFGVTRAKNEGIAEIGCTAEILKIVKSYSDGRSDILTQGRQRFEILQVNRERAFLQAEVFYLEDEAGNATSDEVEQAMHLFDEIVALAGARPEETGAADPQFLSFRLAGSLPLDLDFKQSLLGMKSEPERLRVVISYFQTILPDIKRTLHIRKKAGGNGHSGTGPS